MSASAPRAITDRATGVARAAWCSRPSEVEQLRNTATGYPGGSGPRTPGAARSRRAGCDSADATSARRGAPGAMRDAQSLRGTCAAIRRTSVVERGASAREMCVHLRPQLLAGADRAQKIYEPIALGYGWGIATRMMIGHFVGKPLALGQWALV